MRMPLIVSDGLSALNYIEAICRYAWVDIRLRFDRTTLGPFWVVLTSLMWVLSVGLVMTELFKQSLADNLPYLTFSVFAWQYVSTSIMEAGSAFVGQKHFVGAYRLPLMFFVLRAVARNAIILGVLTVVAFVVAIAFGTLKPSMLVHLLPVLAIYMFIAVQITVIFGCIGARFLDLQPLLTIILNIMMIVTPIFWQKKILPPEHLLVAANPFVPVLDLYRELFLHGGAPVATYVKCLMMALILAVVASIVYQTTQHRVRNWL